jgi:hypothetical protein
MTKGLLKSGAWRHAGQKPVSLSIGRLWIFSLAFAPFLTSPVYAQSASTYQDSCTQIGVQGGMISAYCRRTDGAFTPSSIPIPGIDNVDGVLQFDGTLEPSTFQNSCWQIAIQGDVLYAVCRGHGGMANQTSIEIPGVVNIDGVLQYADGGGPAPGPDEEADGFVWDGSNYDWYDDGWNGPGYYIIGYQYRQGYGFGGGEGWRGHHHRGGRPGFGGGAGAHREHEFHPGGQPGALHPNGAPNNGFPPGDRFRRENRINPPAQPAGQQPQFHQQVGVPGGLHQGGGAPGGNFHPGAGGAPGGGAHPGGNGPQQRTQP